MEEISVLDYIRLKLKRENWGREILPDGEAADLELSAADNGSVRAGSLPERFGGWISAEFDRSGAADVPFERWTFFAAVALALTAQIMMEPLLAGPFRNGTVAGLLYGLAAVCIAAGAFYRRFGDLPIGNARDVFEGVSDGHAEIPGGDRPDESVPEARNDRFHLLFAFGFTALAFVLFGGNRFNFVNLSFWILAVAFSIFAALGTPTPADLKEGARKFVRSLRPLRITVTPWAALCAFVFGVALWMRFHALTTVPTDMFSDHAEKLYDIRDVLNGASPIFFVRNTGREAFQFYWTLLMIRVFGTGISFLSLKIGAALAGLIALPFVYLIGKRIGGKWVAISALFFCGVAYWPNVISRAALRFSFYPMFTAPAFYFFLKGWDTRRPLPMILSGLCLGVGLQGYSAMRIVPLLFLILFAVVLIQDAPGARRESFRLFGIFAWFTLLGVLPLLNVALTNPAMVWYRAFSRLDTAVSPESVSAPLVFLSNLWKALIMPFWSNGRIWVHSIPYRPAFDVVTAVFYFIGVLTLTLRAIRKRETAVIALLISIPVLMLPSALSIAFPDENPSLNRTGAAAIPMTVAAGYGLWRFWSTLVRTFRGAPSVLAFAAVIVVLILGKTAQTNADLVFHVWQNNYAANAWNTHQIGSVVRGFDESIGDAADAYVVPSPHWVDTRLVGITAGFPDRDFALAREDLATVAGDRRPLLFILRDGDTESETEIMNLFPDARARSVVGTAPGKDFRVLYVP